MSESNILGPRQIGNITSTNLIVYAKCAEISPVATRVTDFADGDGITQADKEHAVTKTGVDGRFVYGLVARPNELTMNLLPTSPFLRVVNQCVGLQKSRLEGLPWEIEITYPSIGEVQTFYEGILVSYPELTGAQETLANKAVTFHFGYVDTSTIDGAYA